MTFFPGPTISFRETMEPTDILGFILWKFPVYMALPLHKGLMVRFSNQHRDKASTFKTAKSLALTATLFGLYALTSCSSGGYKIAALDCEQKPTAEQRSECRGLKMMSNREKATFYIKKSQSEMANDEVQESVNSSGEAVTSDPSFSKSFYQQAIAEMNAGNPTRAIEAFNLVLKKEPNNARAYYFKGLMLEQLHKYEEAVEAFTKSTELNEDSPEAHYHRANLLKDFQNRDEAIKSYKAAYTIWQNRLKRQPDLLEDQPDTKEAFYKTQYYLRSVGAIEKKVYYISYAE